MSPLTGPTRPAIAAIVPAYNEQETLTDVLAVLRAAPLSGEVLAVSDGSTDDTVAVARALGVKTIHLKKNRGKGTALATGVAHTGAGILVFVDGDILNLSDYLLNQLVEPVLAGEAAMNIGIRNRGWPVNAVHRHTGPLLSGIRCLRREVFEAVPDRHLAGYRIETALNWACHRLGGRCKTTVLYQLKHRVKERKLGLLDGLASRFRMFLDVFAAWLDLRLRPPALHLHRRSPSADAELEYINF